MQYFLVLIQPFNSYASFLFLWKLHNVQSVTSRLTVSGGGESEISLERRKHRLIAILSVQKSINNTLLDRNLQLRLPRHIHHYPTRSHVHKHNFYHEFIEHTHMQCLC